MKNRYVIFFLTVLLAFCFSSTCFAEAFSDIGEATYVDEITTLAEQGIIQGDDSGAFRPNDSITSAEFAKLVCMISKDYESLKIESNIFDDVPDDYWAKTYINYCYYKKIINGINETTKHEPLYFVDLDENGNVIGISESIYLESVAAASEPNHVEEKLYFAPETPITYNEAVKMLVVFLGYEPYAEVYGYPEGYIKAAEGTGLGEGIIYNGDDYITREIASKLIYDAINIPPMEVRITDKTVEYFIPEE